MSIEEYYRIGIMKDLLDRGLVTPTAFRSAEIQANFNHLRDQGRNKTQAVKQTSDMCRVCESTVWRVVKIMNKK